MLIDAKVFKNYFNLIIDFTSDLKLSKSDLARFWLSFTDMA